MSPIRTRAYRRRQQAAATVVASPTAELPNTTPASPTVKEEPLEVPIPKKRKCDGKDTFFNITQAGRDHYILVEHTRYRAVPVDASNHGTSKRGRQRLNSAGASNEPDLSSESVPRVPENAPRQDAQEDTPKTRKRRVVMAYVLVPPRRRQRSSGQRLSQSQPKAHLRSRSHGRSCSRSRSRSRSRSFVDPWTSSSSQNGLRRRSSQRNSSSSATFSRPSSQAELRELSSSWQSLAGRRPSQVSGRPNRQPQFNTRLSVTTGAFDSSSGSTMPVLALPRERARDSLGVTNFLAFCFRGFPSLEPNAHS
ncbi:hypothetical protein BD309DRAFT_503802 [Dichomitus squalens]|nr:hypothetical protein BD309DRAFT_503802 [Dichomitus squalens]